MPQTTPTVTIKTENGPVVINLTDYKPDEHELVEQVTEAISAAKSEPTPLSKMKKPELVAHAKSVGVSSKGTVDEIQARILALDPPQPLVAKRDDKFFVVDKDDVAIVSDTINADGYATEEEANGAIALLVLQG